MALAGQVAAANESETGKSANVKLESSGPPLKRSAASELALCLYDVAM
jgi:hypothetical protein